MLYSIEHIAAILKAARIKKGLSQRELSARTKIPQAHISKIEKGEVNIQLTSLIEISRHLDLEPMLIPRPLVPAVKALINYPNTTKQIPKYRLDEEEEEEDE